MSGHEENSIKEAGGCAAGFTGRFFNFNADAEAKLADALLTVGKYVQGESGCLLGHIKAAVFVEDGKGITLNLIDMDNGVEHHGTMPRCDEVKFNFMCAVLDVDEYDLTHKMLHAIDDSGIDYFIDKESLEHHHHHHDGGECDDPECECHKHHHDGECSCGHHHDHEECDDPECECHKHHHEHGECCCGHHHDHDECDDPDCDCHKHKHDLASMIDEHGHFSHHHHHHDHEHGEECHCHDHDHEHHHDGECCCGHHHDDEEHEHHHHHDGECCCHKDEEPEKKKKGLFGFLKRK